MVMTTMTTWTAMTTLTMKTTTDDKLQNLCLCLLTTGFACLRWKFMLAEAAYAFDGNTKQPAQGLHIATTLEYIVVVPLTIGMLKSFCTR